jgi:cell division protein DivIC
LSAQPKHNITKLQTNYALEKEESQISIARRKKGLYRRLTVFFVIVKLNDDEYIAKLARKEYFLSNDNEIIFTLPETESQEKVKVSN